MQIRSRALALTSLILSSVIVPAMAAQPSALAFSVEQANRGKLSYAQRCASCHGASLEGSGMSPALSGAAFQRKWVGQSGAVLHAQLVRMPPGAAAPAPPEAHADLFAYLLQMNGIASSENPVPTDPSLLPTLAFAETRQGTPPASQTSSTVPIGPSRLDHLTEVTDASLRSPSSSDWLMWRRTYDGFGFSPLKQIDRRNAKDLRIAWSWSLPQGGNMMAPIVHDGVLFAYSYGDIVEALDATTGDLLWRHERKLEGTAVHQGKKGVAIHGNTLLVPTSDVRVLALDTRTGAVRWDHAIDTRGQKDFQIKSAPLVVGNKVVVGLNGFHTVKGGSFIVALDIDSGKEVWRFYTIARPGEPGGESWNGLPLEARSGGSIWVGGTYDADLNLLYFGAAPTYDTKPLRSPVQQRGVTNEALYTNSTLALNADTGKLVWYFQHQANDQLDHDWAFERQVVELTVNGKRRKTVVTGGKLAIFEALDAATGAYLFSIDLGLQNVIASIDPSTGAKTINPAAIPATDAVLNRITIPGICPDLLGARNLMAGSYDAGRRTLYVPLTDTCRHPFPNGPRWQKESGDGFGLIKAINLDTREVSWTHRQSAPFTSAMLATGGGVLFAGSADRRFRAYDDRDGRLLWQARLDNFPVSYPVTYSVNGQQYIAVATNEGFVHATAMLKSAGLTGTPNGGATLWVFALPQTVNQGTRE
ncbi:alcohol dehydrogenase (cytochrome c) [Povalibacter uvarum]|uniref:Alcohol dehydrogenase (Cytochrome c) n=1 Tax=Povalibacter uvarum TaxID=732238 RepID=A0A841HJV4_9GAMM|nr:PQQ-binding-like beta-propeller repeat protein [Povalibacter uvarum]MBB6093491.1 alcohol dehydrogenase (cytochrome c) [Povalibacter uvarum]